MSSEVSIGGQIRTLRQAAGLKSIELAAALDLDPSAITNIENGQRSVKARELSEIAKFLGVSQLAILEPDSLLGRLPVAARVGDAKGLAGDVAQRLTRLAELHHVLASNGHSPPSTIQSPPAEEPRWLERANSLATWAAQQLDGAPDDDDPFTNLITAIESKLRIDVAVQDLGAQGPLGASITDESFSLILVNASQDRSRALFTLAHELGHVLHRDGTTLNIDTDLRAHNDTERSANSFAAALIMPEPVMSKIIDEFGRGAQSLAQMILTFGVSFQTLIYRMHNLQIINARGRDMLTSVGWAGLLARLDNAELREQLLVARGSQPETRPPVLLAARALAGMLDGSIGAAPLAGLLNVDVDEIIDLMHRAEANDSTGIDDDYSTPIDSESQHMGGFDLSPV